MSARADVPLDRVGDHYDVIVAGARVAGASTAMLLARSGLRVLVVDPVPPDRDALSTHALMRAGVLQLHRWGLLDELQAAGTPPVRTTVFHYAADQVPVRIKEADGIDALFAPRRTILDPLLRRAAVAAGANVVHGAAVKDLLRGPGGRVTGAVIAAGTTLKPVRADVVIGADGVHSRVARLVGAPLETKAAEASATIYGYWPDPHPGEYHWMYVPGAGAGSISTNDGQACVFVAFPTRVFLRRRGEGLAALHRGFLRTVSPELADFAALHAPTGGLHGFAGIPGFLRRAWGPGWALVGDAGYFKDPATAHGMTDAVRDAELLARAVLAGTDGALRGYQEARDAVVRDFMATTDRIASFDWDLDEVRDLHLELSREMNDGLDLVRAWGPLPEVRAVAVTP